YSIPLCGKMRRVWPSWVPPKLRVDPRAVQPLPDAVLARGSQNPGWHATPGLLAPTLADPCSTLALGAIHSHHIPDTSNFGTTPQNSSEDQGRFNSLLHYPAVYEQQARTPTDW